MTPDGRMPQKKIRCQWYVGQPSRQWTFSDGTCGKTAIAMVEGKAYCRDHLEKARQRVGQ